MDIYNTVPAAKLKRSMFHWKKERYQSQDFGAIVPFFWREVLPGDIWKISQSNFIRVQPMVSAPFTPMRFYSEFWYFPTRVLMQKYYPEVVDAWETFIFGGPNGDGANEAGQTPTLPLWVPNASNVKLAGINVALGVQSRKTGNADAKGSLWDYFGLPVNQGFHDLDNNGHKVVGGVDMDYSPFLPLKFGKIAYNLLWNEFKRNQNFENPVSLDSEDIQLAKWKKDRYTSALPYQQRLATPLALPLTGLGGVTFANGIEGISGSIPAVNVGLLRADQTALFQKVSFNEQAGSSNPSSATVGTLNDVHGWLSNGDINDTYAWTAPTYANSHLTKAQLDASAPTVNFAQAGTVTPAQFRTFMQTQKWLERAMRGGVRYIEGLLSFFGTAPNSDVLNLPQFIGGMKQNIIVNEVLQTSQTATTPQGNIAGRGISAAGENIGIYHAREHGYIMGICWIKPDLYYSSQGVKKEWTRRSKYDFYWPQFAHLAEQPIMRSELFASPATQTPDQMGGSDGLFGYNGIYDEYRSSENEICGEMRDTFAYWHCARSFSSAPQLGADFINCFPRKDCFAVKNEDEFLLDILTDVKVYRPMPVEPVPGLVDHF